MAVGLEDWGFGLCIRFVTGRIVYTIEESLTTMVKEEGAASLADKERCAVVRREGGRDCGVQGIKGHEGRRVGGGEEVGRAITMLLADAKLLLHVIFAPRGIYDRSASEHESTSIIEGRE